MVMNRGFVKGERGFTLIEMTVSLGVIAIIGTLLLSGVISANTNTETADLIVFMDNVTKESREVFESNPNDILQGNVVTSDSNRYPYNEMVYQSTDEDNISYTKSYTKSLNSAIPGSAEENYQLIVSFTGTDNPLPEGFSFKTKSYSMEAKVFEKIDGTMSREAIYTKNYTFDNITVKEFPTVGEIKKVTFQGNGGCVVNSETRTDCIGSSIQREYFKGDSIYATSIDGLMIPAGYQGNKKFIGWSQAANDRNLLQNDYKIEEDTSVYAQYLSADTYRLEFRISGAERFNVDGITGEAVTKPYFIEKKPASTPVYIKDMEHDITRFFVNNAVRKNGYNFLYWEDIDGNPVNVNTELDDNYMILYPHFEALDDADQEIISLNLTLDLNGITAGEDNGTERLFARYPFTKMEYELQYDDMNDAFIVIQKEFFNGDYGSLTEISKGTLLSEKRFTTSSDNLKFTYANSSYSTLTEYIQAVREDSSHSFSVSDIRLKIKMPTFNLKDYYTGNYSKDDLRSGGVTLNANQAELLFGNPETSEFVFKGKEGDQLPVIDTVSLTKLADKISDMTDNNGDFSNTGSIFYDNSGDVSYGSYDIEKVIPGKEQSIMDKRFRQVHYHYVVPTSNVLYSGGASMRVSDVETYVKDNTIWLKLSLKFNNGNWAVYSKEPTEFSTGIPYETNQKDSQGNDLKDPRTGRVLKQYTRIKQLNISVDGWSNDISRLNSDSSFKTRFSYLGGTPAGFIYSWYPLDSYTDFTAAEVKYLNKESLEIIKSSVPQSGKAANLYSNKCPIAGTYGPYLMSPICASLPQMRWVGYEDYFVRYINYKTDDQIVKQQIMTFKGNQNKSYLPSFVKNIPYTGS